MTYKEALEQVETMQGRVAYKERQITSLINQYGTGVRPSWVSTDLSIYTQQMQDYAKDLSYAEYVVAHYEAKQDALADKEGE
jgi:predicted transcriptional regulator